MDTYYCEGLVQNVDCITYSNAKVRRVIFTKQDNPTFAGLKVSSSSYVRWQNIVVIYKIRSLWYAFNSILGCLTCKASTHKGYCLIASFGGLKKWLNSGYTRDSTVDISV